MYRSILVPLDGSTFAEHALAVAVAIAERHWAKVTLVRACDPANHRYSSDFTVPEAEGVGAPERLAAIQYLSTVAARLRPTTTVGIQVALLAGSPAEAITEYLTRTPIDLVVMTTHGLTGWNRAWIGSVADSIVRMARTPVLLCRPPERPSETSPGQFARVLLPLDGSAESEQVVAHAARICGGAHFILVRALRPVVTPMHPYPYIAAATETDHAGTEAEVARARDYLNSVAAELTAQHPEATVDVDVRVGEWTAAAIVEAAHDYAVDLVALTTHARRGVRLVLGSVADKVLRGTRGSVLLLQPSPVPALPGPEATPESFVSGII